MGQHNSVERCPNSAPPCPPSLRRHGPGVSVERTHPCEGRDTNIRSGPRTNITTFAAVAPDKIVAGTILTAAAAATGGGSGATFRKTELDGWVVEPAEPVRIGLISESRFGLALEVCILLDVGLRPK